MQNQNGVPRGTLLFISGAAALAACYISYKYITLSHNQAHQAGQLHRRNAVRRRRRPNAGDGAAESVRPGHTIITRSLSNLQQREADGEGYDRYRNRYYVNEEVLASPDAGGLQLLPSKLETIRDIITRVHNLSEDLSMQLIMHIQIVFIQNFFEEEYPDGWIFGEHAYEFAHQLGPHLDVELVESVIRRYDRGHGRVEGDMYFQDEATEEMEARNMSEATRLAQALSGDPDARDTHDGRTSRGAPGEEAGDGNNILDLLYRIGEEQAKWSGYQHRGVECNWCGMQPIRGIRYHCANCWDYDLCETCEHQQIHHKTHVFYKIRIPAPTRGQIKLVQPKWYPGNPNSCPETIPHGLKMMLLRDTQVDRQDLDALYDQFRCIAGSSWPKDPDGIGMGIDRSSFDRYFTSTTADRPSPPNAIYDRIFAFYDRNNEGLIGFADFVVGMSELTHNTSREARIQRLFRAFDFDDDGFVSRRDFLMILQAYYSLNKELAHEMIYARDDALLTDEDIHDVINSSNPISAAFGGYTFASHRSRHGEGKHVDVNGDMVFDNGLEEILKEDGQMTGDRATAIARQASESRTLIAGHRLKNGDDQRDEPLVSGHHLPPMPTMREEDSIMGSPRSNDEGVDRLGHIADSWPTNHVQQEDVQQALGASVDMHDVMDPMDRRRVLSAQRDRLYSELEANNHEIEQTALHDRWQRRKFYLDVEEGFTKPAGYAESDSSDEGDTRFVNGGLKKVPSLTGSRGMSLRSRSSSKVRFDDSAIENDADSKSDISSRNTPINERWGGFELSQPNRDVGVELIYEAIEEAFNDMLNHFFKEKEDKAIDAKRSRAARKQYAHELKLYEDELAHTAQRKEDALLQADMERTNELLKLADDAGGSGSAEPTFKEPLEDEQAKADAENEAPCDPTLPQHRPNAPGFGLTEEDNEGNPAVKIDRALLALWHEHNLVDAEAEIRGGFGRLNLPEFKRKLRDGVSDIDIGGEGQDEDFWEAKADLGKFSFLSSWIEMASF